MARTDRKRGSANQTSQTSFTGGEIGPRVRGRIDHDLYGVSLKEATNVVIHPQGPVSRRPGTEFVSEVSPPSNLPGQLFHTVGFEGPLEDSYTLVFRDAVNWGSRVMVFRNIDGKTLPVHQPWVHDYSTTSGSVGIYEEPLQSHRIKQITSQSRSSDDGVIASLTGAAAKTFESANADFVAADKGCSITINGAAGGGGNLSTTIASVTDEGEVVLANAASTTVSGATWTITDPDSIVEMDIPVFPSEDTFVKMRTDAALASQNMKPTRCDNVVLSSTEVLGDTADDQWQLFPLEVPVTDGTSLQTYRGTYDASANTGSFVRFTPTTGTYLDVPERFRFLLNGYFISHLTTSITGDKRRVRLLRLGIYGAQCGEMTSTTRFVSGDTPYLDARDISDLFTITNDGHASDQPFFKLTEETNLNLTMQLLDDSKFQATGLSIAATYTGGDCFFQSETFVPAQMEDIKESHSTQGINSIVFASQNFKPFELYFTSYPTMCSGGSMSDIGELEPLTPAGGYFSVGGTNNLGLGTAGHFEYHQYYTDRMTAETCLPCVKLPSTSDAAMKNSFYPVNYPHYVKGPQKLKQGGVASIGDKLEYAFYVTCEDYTTGHESFAQRIDISQDNPPSAANYDASSAPTGGKITLNFYPTGTHSRTWNLYQFEPGSLRFLFIKRVTFTTNVHSGQEAVEITDATPWGVEKVELTDADGASVELGTKPADAELAARSPNRQVDPFSGDGNYPGTVTFSGQRLCFAGSRNSPEAIWLSGIDRYTDFTATQAFDELDRANLDIIRDDSAIQLSGASKSVSRVRSLISMQELLAFTRDGENRIGAGNFSSVTPATAGVYPQSGYGTSDIQPIIAEDSVLYVSQAGSSIRDLRYAADGLAGAAYGGKDLSILARHMFDEKNIVDWGYARPPTSILYVILDSGEMLTATYNPEHEVVGWARYETEGLFKCVVASPDARTGSIVSALVERSLPGSAADAAHTYLERVQPLPEVDVGVVRICSDSAVSTRSGEDGKEITAERVTLYGPDADGFIFAAHQIVITVAKHTPSGEFTRDTLKHAERIRVEWDSSKFTVNDPANDYFSQLDGQEYYVRYLVDEAAERTGGDLKTINGNVEVVAPSGAFVASDVGRQILVKGAKSSGVDLVTTVASRTNSTTITLTDAPGVSFSTAVPTYWKLFRNPDPSVVSSEYHQLVSLHPTKDGSGNPIAYGDTPAVMSTRLSSGAWYTAYTRGALKIFKTDGPVGSVSGLYHLAGKNVEVNVSGTPLSRTVDSSGTFSFLAGNTFSEIVVGLPYTARVRTLPHSDARRGTVRGNPKRVSRVTVSLLDTKGVKIGMGDGELVDAKDPLDESGLSDSSLRTGDRNVAIRGTYDYYGEVVVEQSDSNPMTLLGIFPEMNIGDL